MATDGFVLVVKIEMRTTAVVTRHKADHFILIKIYRAHFFSRFLVRVEVHAHLTVCGRKRLFVFLFVRHFVTPVSESRLGIVRVAVDSEIVFKGPVESAVICRTVVVLDELHKEVEHFL